MQAIKQYHEINILRPEKGDKLKKCLTDTLVAS